MPMTSSAPHIDDATTVGGLTDWGVQPEAIEGQSRSSGLLLHKRADGAAECGLWQCTPGSWRLGIPGDELCYFVSGCAISMYSIKLARSCGAKPVSRPSGISDWAWLRILRICDRERMSSFP